MYGTNTRRDLDLSWVIRPKLASPCNFVTLILSHSWRNMFSWMFAGLAVGLTTYCIWMSKILWCREASRDVIVSSQGPFHQWIFIRIQEFAELFSPKWHDRCWYMLLSYIFVLLIVTTQLAEIDSKIQFPFSLIMSEIAFVKWPTGHLFYYSASCLESKRPIMERTPHFREMKRPIYHVWSKWCTKKHIFWSSITIY